MARYVNQELWLQKIHSIARAEELDLKDKQKTKSNQTRTCFNCSRKSHCKKFQKRYSLGASSIGGDAEKFVCKDWKEKKSMQNPAQIKNLLKQFKNKAR